MRMKGTFSFGLYLALAAAVGCSSSPSQVAYVGLPFDEALENMVRRVRSDDLELMATAISIQHQVGGNLAEILDSIAYTIRERVRIRISRASIAFSATCRCKWMATLISGGTAEKTTGCISLPITRANSMRTCGNFGK